MSITVLIPAINESSSIGGAVRSAADAGAEQIVVCDGGSSDQTIAIAERSGADHVVTSSPGRGVQLAAGLESADQRWICILHADNRLHRSAFCELIDCDDDDVWGGMRQQIDAPERVYRWIERGNAARVRFRGMVLGDQAMFFSRSMIDRVGGIPAVGLLEDVWISRAMRRVRWPVLLSGPVTVDARRWRRRGVVRQTVLNWRIQVADKVGVGEERLRGWYCGPSGGEGEGGD